MMSGIAMTQTVKDLHMNTYPFAGEIKMTKVVKDGQEVIAREPVSITYHADGNVGIGTPWQVKLDASAPLVMGEPVERIRFIMSNQEPEAYAFAYSTEWARVDKDLNITHLDMELCSKGPPNVYTALAMAIWNKATAQERKAMLEVLEDLRGYSGVGTDGNPYDTPSWNAALKAAEQVILERIHGS